METSQETKAKQSETKKMDPVVHFEMPAEDKKRMSDFYSNVFGWETKMLGNDQQNYVLVSTTEVDKTGRLTSPGAINGGFYQKEKDKPAQYPSVVIAVDNLKESMRKIEKTGGKIIGEPVEIKDFGWYVSFYDTENNRVSMMEPTMEMKSK
jgi:predicted enzyme related to lactoylglutathione lyase